MMDFPVAYVLKHRVWDAYVPNTNFGYAVMDHIASDHRPTYVKFYTNDITLAKMWPTYKKIKRRLTEASAVNFDIIGSDHSVIPATDLFK